MKALITGASGFIGSTLIEKLHQLGFEIRALMRSSSSLKNLNGMHYERFEGHLGDFESLKKAVSGVDYVFHLAGATAAPDRDAYFEANAWGTERLARAVAEVNPGLKRFVLVSSLAAAGPASSQTPRTEAEAEQPVSFYGESKLQGERELLKYKDQFQLSIVRPPMVYGPRDKGVFVIIQTVARNLMPIIQGGSPDGQKYYSAIHSEDLCRGIIQAALMPSDAAPSGEKFYLTASAVHSYREFLATIAECLDRDPFVFRIPRFVISSLAWGLSGIGKMTGKTFPLNLDKLNELRPDYWVCSNEKATRVLNFSPEFDLRSGMTQTIGWYRQEKWL
ncbi:MAG TPA: hypothetical protein DCS07_05140 [Bdellovibrionales bacterium]|nr:MAG: hypothetical protein A2X97_07595 [Bdellovibrionales bacterium GWA1_52_35]OFZ40323.1 MAG: hypothetical protein A2070_11620 [Bdellovibrionales bacterium GWC1_52_8]HAR42005.1 hypothetical protein [Bdellovibrionales bacterium]HCM41362.1 hypothetical protein [Bdellovibrionales bacterium]